MTTAEIVQPQKQTPFVLEQVRVLLAEEDDFFRWVLDRLLVESGYQVTTASTGASLLTHLGRAFERAGSVPHVIVASAHLPDVSGLTILERLHMTGWRAPYILLADAGDGRAQERAWRAGASYLLQKPFDPERLVGAVEQIASGQGRGDASPAR